MAAAAAGTSAPLIFFVCHFLCPCPFLLDIDIQLAAGWRCVTPCGARPSPKNCSAMHGPCPGGAPRW